MDTSETTHNKKAIVIDLLRMICSQGNCKNVSSLDLATVIIFADELLAQGELHYVFPEGPEIRCSVNKNRALRELKDRVLIYFKRLTVPNIAVEDLATELFSAALPIDLDRGVIVLAILDGDPCEIYFEDLDRAVEGVDILASRIHGLRHRVSEDVARESELA
ncbi:MAG: hypothetical protein O3B47_00650 [bacterium]|nr:hypothetical protein [bacterium]